MPQFFLDVDYPFVIWIYNLVFRDIAMLWLWLFPCIILKMVVVDTKFVLINWIDLCQNWEKSTELHHKSNLPEISLDTDGWRESNTTIFNLGLRTTHSLWKIVETNLMNFFFCFLQLFKSWMFCKLANKVYVNHHPFVNYGFKTKAINLYKTNKSRPNLSDSSASCMTGSFLMEAWIMFLSHFFCWEWFTTQLQDGLVSKKEALLNWMIN